MYLQMPHEAQVVVVALWETVTEFGLELADVPLDLGFQLRSEFSSQGTLLACMLSYSLVLDKMSVR